MEHLRLRRTVRTERFAPEGTTLLLFVHGGLGDRIVFEAIVRAAIERSAGRKRIVAVIPFHDDEYDARRYPIAPDEVWVLDQLPPDDVVPLAQRVQRSGLAAFGWAGQVETICHGPPGAGVAREAEGCRFVEPYSHLAELAGGAIYPRFVPTPDARAQAAAWAGALRGEDGRPVIALHCRTRERDAGKNPDPGDVARAAHLLREALGARTVAIGDDVPPALAREVDTRIVDYDPRLDDLGAHLEACSLLVGGESGPLHLAAAVGTPVVGLLAPGKGDGSWGPFAPSTRKRVLPGRDGPPGVPLRFAPEAILSAARELLAMRGS